MRVLSIVGNRPQFIKSAPVSDALVQAGVTEVVTHTGQHYDAGLSEVFFAELGLSEPAHRLDARTADPAALTRLLEKVLGDEDAVDWVLVYGDTNSTRAGADAASTAGARVAHVEAGLRSGDLSMPEERNRIHVDRVADLLFCPDERSGEVLRGEEVQGRVEVVGDVMADVARVFGPLARERSDILRRYGLSPGGYVVATVHREANVRPERLARILEGLGRSTDVVVLPSHPRTLAVIAEEALDVPDRVRLVEPLGYLDLAALAMQARVIATDSGGLQKEAYWYGVPCVTMRPSTEWVDTIEVGANRLVDDDPDLIAQGLDKAQMPAERPVLYGDGHAAERIAALLRGDSLPRP